MTPCGQKSLRLTSRFKPAHLPFAVASRLMRHLSAIVGVTVSVMSDVGHDGSFCGAITFELVGDDSERFFALASQQSLKESFGRMLIPPCLHQDIDDVPPS